MKVLKNLMKWQNYLHYLLLTIGLVIFLHFMEVPYYTFHTAKFMPNLNFVWLFLFIIVVDTVIHFILSILPEPFKWED